MVNSVSMAIRAHLVRRAAGGSHDIPFIVEGAALLSAPSPPPAPRGRNPGIRRAPAIRLACLVNQVDGDDAVRVLHRTVGVRRLVRQDAADEALAQRVLIGRKAPLQNLSPAKR